jgi:hypothetical protein
VCCLAGGWSSAERPHSDRRYRTVTVIDAEVCSFPAASRAIA